MRKLIRGLKKHTQNPGALMKRNNGLKAVAVVAVVGTSVVAAHAGTDATAITTSVDTAFAAVATLCVSIGTFFAVYKLVKKIR